MAKEPLSILSSSLHPTHAQMAQQAYGYMQAKLNKPWAALFALGLMAGMFIALAGIFYLTVMTGSAELPWGLARLISGLVFSLGLVLIVVCGGELFTSSVMTIMVLANRAVSGWQMLCHWLVVFLANAMGTLLVVLLVYASGLWQSAEGLWLQQLMKLLNHKMHHGWWQAVVLGLLCNLLVCLAVWLTFSSKRALDKALLMVMPVALFVAAGFEHAIANLFFLPLAWLLVNLLPAEQWLQLGMDPLAYQSLSLLQILAGNIIPVALGNVLGGSLVALSYWAIYPDLQPESAQAHECVTHELPSVAAPKALSH